MSELTQTAVPVAIGPRPDRMPSPPVPERPPRPDLTSLVAFPDPDVASAVVATCRTELSADLGGGGADDADALLILLVAKALDETEGSTPTLVLPRGTAGTADALVPAAESRPVAG